MSAKGTAVNALTINGFIVFECVEVVQNLPGKLIFVQDIHRIAVERTEVSCLSRVLKIGYRYM